MKIVTHWKELLKKTLEYGKISHAQRYTKLSLLKCLYNQKWATDWMHSLSKF
jgi:hypothetical protein